MSFEDTPRIFIVRLRFGFSGLALTGGEKIEMRLFDIFCIKQRALGSEISQNWRKGIGALKKALNLKSESFCTIHSAIANKEKERGR